MGGSPPEPEVNFFVPRAASLPLPPNRHARPERHETDFAAFGADGDDEFPLVAVGQRIAGNVGKFGDGCAAHRLAIDEIEAFGVLRFGRPLKLIFTLGQRGD